MTQAARQVPQANARQAGNKKVGRLARLLLPSLGGLSALLMFQLLVTNSWRFLL